MDKKVTRRKGTLIILSVSLLLISSLAFFTDNKLNSKNAIMGNLGIETKLYQDDVLDNLAPGDDVGLSLEVINTGSLEVDTRLTLRVSVAEDLVDDYKLDDLILKVDNAVVVNLVNEEFYFNSGLIGVGNTVDYHLSLEVSSELKNAIQGNKLKIEILTEARQVDSPEWHLQATDSIRFGDSEDFKVVPASRRIRSSEMTINRLALLEGDTLAAGYVSTTLDNLETYDVDTFKDKFLNTTDNLNVYSDGVLLDADEEVLSGSIVKLEEDGETHDELVVILKGDLDGDGYVGVGNDVVVMFRVLNEAMYGTPKQYSDKTYIAADIDDNGLITHNDLLFLRDYNMGGDELPEFYPQAPRLPQTPVFGIRVGDSDLVDWEDEDVWSIGNTINRGGFVESGQLIKVAVDIKNLRGIDITSLVSNLNFDLDLVEPVLMSEEESESWVITPVGDEGIFPFSIGNRGQRIDHWSNHISTTPFDNGLGRVAFIGYRRQRVGSSMEHGADVLKETGQLGYISLRVKDDVPSGTRINFSLSDSNFAYDGFGNLSFHGVVNNSASTYVVVK